MRFVRSIALVWTTIIILFSALSAAQETILPEGRKIQLVDSLCLSPDGENLVFEWREDLWTVSTRGGGARRITSHPARDAHPNYSPDGETLYFCSTRAGALQLFSIPVSGGQPTQHTFHSEGCTLEGISPDGRFAMVRGLRDEPGFRPYRLIQIDLNRSSPEEYLFNEAGGAGKWFPDGSRIIFTRDGEQLYRKGYRGPRASSIWTYDPTTEGFQSQIKESAEARWPLPMKNGEGFYYVSERDGCFNLWARQFEGDLDTKLTHFTDDGVMFPAIAANRSTIVFRRGFDLYRIDPEANTAPEKIEIYHREDLPNLRWETRNITGTVDADFSTSGLEIVFKAEGELWAMDTILREPNRLTRTDGAEDDPVFSNDGQYIYYLLDDGLEANVWRISRTSETDFWWRATSFEYQQITFGSEAIRKFAISPDGTRLAWVSVSGNLSIAEVDGTSPRVLFESWDPPSFDWSPDSRWIVFAAQDENFNKDIYLVPADGSKKPFNISRHPDFEGSPKWSPDGSKVAFVGRRLNDQLGLFYVDLLEESASQSNRRHKEFEAEKAMQSDPNYDFDDDPQGNSSVVGAHELGPDEKDLLTPTGEVNGMTIDFEGLPERVVRLNTRGIQPERILWTNDSRSILFQSINRSTDALYSIDSLPRAKMEKLADRRGLPIRAREDGSLVWIVDRQPETFSKGKKTNYPISARVVRDRVAHQKLSYRLIWRTLRDRYYDPKMNGLDWNALRIKYERHAATAPKSRTFDSVVEMLLGELNSSHLKFVSGPGSDAWQSPRIDFQQTRHLGLKFGRAHKSGQLIVVEVIPDSPADFSQPPIQSGDIVVSINGKIANSDSPIPQLLNGRMDQRVSLVVSDDEGNNHQHEIQPITYDEATELAERALITAARQRVETLSSGRLGYVHIARMFWDDFEEFERQIYAAGHGKDGLVIDVRDNGGGFTTDHLLTVLCQPRHAITIPRGGAPGYPQHRKVYASWHKPLIVVCNQNTYSNAEIFAHAIKSLGRGKLVGVTTAGGVISADRDRILDTGTLRIPFRGWFQLGSGEDMEMHGAKPDYVVWPDPADLISGNDPQLKTAVQVLLDEVEHAPTIEFVPHYRAARTENPLPDSSQ